MARYRQLLQWMRQGKSAIEILEAFDGHPSELRRLLNSKELRQQLQLDGRLAATVAAYRTAAAVGQMADRLAALAEGENAETARKACLALLSEGLLAARTSAPSGRAQNEAPELLTPPIEPETAVKAPPARAKTPAKRPTSRAGKPKASRR